MDLTRKVSEIDGHELWNKLGMRPMLSNSGDCLRVEPALGGTWFRLTTDDEPNRTISVTKADMVAFVKSAQAGQYNAMLGLEPVATGV